MNKSESHIVTGMTRDSAVSKFNPKFVYDAQNIRITSRNGDSSFLSVTNERGTQSYTILMRDINGKESNDTVKGTPIGYAVLNNKVIVFTTQTATDDNKLNDHIYRFEEFNNNNNSCHCVCLFAGKLDFNVNNPIETLPLYENEEIQKVYWVDGRNQPRVIDIQQVYTDGDKFNFNRTINFDENFSFVVTKYSTGGQFSVGMIQYAFSYFNKFGQETNLVDISPEYYLSPKNRGLQAGSESNCSFKIQINKADTSFEYVRMYAILRSSANATPVCRILGDYKIQLDGTVTVIDNGIIGSTVDATALLYIGGEDIIASTLQQKDNTLFLGDIHLEQPNIGDIVVKGISLRKYVKNKATVDVVPIDYDGEQFNKSQYNGNPSGISFYDYKNNNNRSAYAVKRFKYGEGYRLGFAAQYKTGKWSEAVWIGDYDNTYMPDLQSSNYRTGGFKCKIPSEVLKKLYDNGFRRIKPLVVLPEGPDRKVIAQGFLCPTIYNVADRKSNAPFAQSSWFVRRYGTKYCGLGDPLASSGITTAKDVNFNGSKRTDSYYDCEIQMMQDNLYGLICAGLPITSSTVTYLTNDTFADYFGEDYGVDSTILTFHSPEIECSDEYSQSDFEGIGIRVMGYSYNPNSWSSFFRSAWNMSEKSVGIDSEHSELINLITDSSDSTRRNALPLFADTAVNKDDTPAAWDKDVLYGWIIYPWHRSGSLNNQGILSTKTVSNGITTRTALLQYKRESSLWYGHTVYAQSDFYGTKGYLHSGVPQLFNSDQVTALKIPEPANSGLGTLIYYGNIDKVETPNMVDLSEQSFYSTTGVGSEKDATGTTEYGTVKGLNKLNGYPILYGWCKYQGTDTAIRSTSSSNYYKSVAELAHGNGGTIDYRRAYFNKKASGGAAWTHTTDEFFGKDPISIKYKSSPHLVVALDYKDSTNAYSLYSRGTMGKSNRSWEHSPFWKSSNDSSFATTEEDVGFTPLGSGVFIADIYRKSIYGNKDSNSEYDAVANAARFGGTSQEAVANNTWLTAGKSVTIDAQDDTQPLLFTQGDCYLERYDCLKTYPFTLEDQNSIVEIWSTEVESRVNLDERYDRNRGLTDNTYITPSIFNLFNHEGYEQQDNFFNYKAIDYDRYRSLDYPNMVTWSLEKTLGEDVDSWTSIDLTSTQDLDGDKGSVTALASYNNDLYCFQNRGLAQLLFNSRVQIATSDGEPIEISNGAKMQGKRYLSSTIGCTNKWSIQETPNGLYFVDDEMKSIYRFNGRLEEVSTKLGMRSWLDNNIDGTVWTPDSFGNIKTFYDKNNQDLYFVTKDTALCYSEILGQFTSFMSYGKVPIMFNVDNAFFCIDGSTNVWGMFQGDYNHYFGTYQPYSLTFISNSDPAIDKVYNNLAWRTIVTEQQTQEKSFVPLDCGFDTLKVWNEHQDTDSVPLTLNKATPSILKKKFNVWRVQIPRDRLGHYRNNRYLNRIRNPWAYIKLSRENESDYKMEFQDLNVDFFE